MDEKKTEFFFKTTAKKQNSSLLVFIPKSQYEEFGKPFLKEGDKLAVHITKIKD